MNILEHYIEKIHSEELVTFTYEGENVTCYKVDLTYNCHGCIKRVTEFFLEDEWKSIKEKGYYLA